MHGCVHSFVHACRWSHERMRTGWPTRACRSVCARKFTHPRLHAFLARWLTLHACLSTRASCRQVCSSTHMQFMTPALCMHAHLHACIPTAPPAFLYACMYARLCASVHACVRTSCVYPRRHSCMLHACGSTLMHTLGGGMCMRIHTCIHPICSACVQACMRACGT